MKNIKTVKKINFPTDVLQDHFSFNVFDGAGDFVFEFHYFNDIWNCWITLPSGEKRQAGVYPNTISWTGYPDYGFVFMTSLADITHDNLLLSSMYLLEWE